MNKFILCSLATGAVLIGAAGCDSADIGTTATATPPSTNAAATSSVAIGSTQGQLGQYLVDSTGRSLYVFDADTSGVSNCSGQCARNWPPVVIPGGQTPSASGAVSAGMLGVIQRTDGSMQVTYNGMPLYYYVRDQAAGDTKGQGVNDSGGLWWVVGSSGTKVTTQSSSTAGGAGGTSL